ncbi:hypothetical protein KW791_02365 [Candidatus Parcubacteria bacterium]|nr:hypothetical protein [Candidatus Parcubacteria bacterium]
MQFKANLFIKEFLLFFSTLLVGGLVAFRYSIINSGTQIIQTAAWSWLDVSVFVGVIIFFLVMTKIRRVAGFIFKVLLILLVFSGSSVVAGAFLSPPKDMIFVGLVLILFLFLRNVLVHNIAVIMAIAGVSALVGVGITPTLAIGALVVLSIYDIIAVYQTKHMVRLAEGMIDSGAIFGFIIPQDFKSFFVATGHAKQQVGNQFMVLGSGDIGLPLIFVSSLMRQSLTQAMIVAGFSLLGVLATHLIFINQRQRQAMAALPPIATMSIIGYLISLYI